MVTNVPRARRSTTELAGSSVLRTATPSPVTRPGPAASVVVGGAATCGVGAVGAAARSGVGVGATGSGVVVVVVAIGVGAVGVGVPAPAAVLACSRNSRLTQP